jgi:hypothetical protein
MLGPDCVLVGRTPQGFRALERGQASTLQKCLQHPIPDGDWLFRQCERISDALNEGQVALAQIYGLHIPVTNLDNQTLRRLALINAHKAGFNPDEPRVPKGQPHGGEWTTGDSQSETDASAGSSAGVPGDNRSPPSDTPSPGLTADFSLFPGGTAPGGGAIGTDPNLGDVDFSDGFHDAVVDAWVKALNEHGTPAVKTVGIRLIDTDGAVIGYPDILIHAPGMPVEAFEVKTGTAWDFTPNQKWYLPLLQAGGHLYSMDHRIEALGLVPGQVFPPIAVYVIEAPGPNQDYEVHQMPPYWEL